MSDPTDLTGRPPRKSDPEELTLRPRPRPVTRINRRVLLLLAAGGALAIFAATMVALEPPAFRVGGSDRELYSVDRKSTPDQLAALPRNYGELPPKPEPPPAVDLDSKLDEIERVLDIVDPTPPIGSNRSGSGYRPDPYEDARRAERLRLERQTQQARESGVFFQTSARPGAAEPGAGQGSEAFPGAEAVLAANAAAIGPAVSQEIDFAGDRNPRSSKQAFMARGPDGEIYSPHALQTPTSPYQIMAGTIIAATLLTGINSDLPGQVIAQVTQNVHDSVTGRYLLIPQGARLIGAYDSLVAFGQDRALVVWQRLIMPDGSSIVLDNLPATDAGGYAGLADTVDHHTGRLLKGIALASLLGVGSELAFAENENDLARAFRESTQDNVNDAGQALAERNLDIQPTVTIRPGWPLRVIVNKDIVLRPYGR